MFCKNCGAKIDGEQRFCPTCGKEISETKQNSPKAVHPGNMTENMGKLLVSTKICGGMLIFFAVISAITVLIGLFILFNVGMFFEDFDVIVGVMVVLLAVTILAIPVIAFLVLRSHCNVYENGVTGMTAMSVNNKDAVMEPFSVRYEDITKAFTSGRAIFIYTAKDKYEILAISNSKTAFKEIQARLPR